MQMALKRGVQLQLESLTMTSLFRRIQTDDDEMETHLDYISRKYVLYCHVSFAVRPGKELTIFDLASITLSRPACISWLSLSV